MKQLLLVIIAVAAIIQSCSFIKRDAEKEYTAYIMPYFKSSSEKLHLAYSYDAKNWTALNNNEPVFDSGVRLRDPFVNRVNGKFHLVHTKGWDHPTIFHWESDDLINWKGGGIDVVDSSMVRAWAPEFFYCDKEEVFYVYWASVVNGHNVMRYLKTKDWKNISNDQSKLYYDIGTSSIDLTIVKHDDLYYGFHKAAMTEDRKGNRMYVSPTLDPDHPDFTFGKDGYGEVVLPNETKPTEGPEVVKLIGQDKWYIYGDPFRSALEAWETDDFKTFTKIDVTSPQDAKHCSFVAVTDEELQALIKAYPSDDNN
ncbi:MAG: glycoside hydrolase family 43 protein [Carboxylicivirga sp.]|jgi:hypothetical protein|nr:glycoside hydrolase family 43 protein [Carboxylicivirga sp.]